MNRRDFLRRASMAAAGAFVLDPEQLLYVPERTYFDLGAKPALVEVVSHADFHRMVAEVWDRVISNDRDGSLRYLYTSSRPLFAEEVRRLDEDYGLTHRNRRA